MRTIHFNAKSFSQYNEWHEVDKKIFNKLQKLIIEAARTPFEGTGKPEALKHEFAGLWSRRITKEHRLVYSVEEDYIEIISCKFHYK